MVAVAQRTRLARKAAGMAAFRRRTRIRGDNILCWGLIALLAVLVIYPLISLVYGSFDATGPDRETATFSLENFSRILSEIGRAQWRERGWQYVSITVGAV